MTGIETFLRETVNCVFFTTQIKEMRDSSFSEKSEQAVGMTKQDWLSYAIPKSLAMATKCTVLLALK